MIVLGNMFMRPNGISKLVLGIFVLACIVVLTFFAGKSSRFHRIGAKVKRIIQEEASYYDENLLAAGMEDHDDHLLNEADPEDDYQGSDMQKRVKEKFYNIAPFYFDDMKQPKQYNRTCAKFPNIYHLFFNNMYYQVLESSNGTFQLYGAYFDTRKANPDVASVRILGQVDVVDPTVPLYCQLWYENINEPIIVPVNEVKLVWNKKFGMMKMKVFYTYLITCKVLEKWREPPLSVSLVEKYCDQATNNLKVNYEVPKEKEMFAVCVKGLDFQRFDLSKRLAEWIELLLILGASKVSFYNMHSHPNIVKLLQYYQAMGVVDLTNITLAGYQPNFDGFQHYYMLNNKGRKRQNELVTYNDCFYKNMYKYQYIVLLDIDEIIVPNIDYTWAELIERIKQKVAETKFKKRTSFAAQNVYFLDEFMNQHDLVEGVPSNYHMLQHVYRTANYSMPGSYNKCFLDTEEILTLHNHFPFACLTKCTNYHMSTDDAQLNHYRNDCDNNLSSCRDMKKNMVQDPVVHKYKDKLIERVSAVLSALRLL